MNQGIGTSLAIPPRSPGFGKAQAEIECHRACILGIYIDFQPRISAYGQLYQGLADACAMMRRIDEESFKATMLNQHESYRAVVCINRNVQRCIRQKACHLRADGLTIPWQQKVVRGIDRICPDFYRAKAIGGAGGANGGHCERL